MDEMTIEFCEMCGELIVDQEWDVERCTCWDEGGGRGDN